MHRRDFTYELPEELIAQQPLARRADSRLLQLERASGACHDRHIRELPDLLTAGDLLVFNDTRVIPARLFGHKASGGKVEIMLERVLGPRRAVAMLRASKSLAEGTEILLQDGVRLTVCGREGAFFQLELQGAGSLQEVLQAQGHMPLPPYIRREDMAADRERYQTVYARQPGAVAAPTAGLHFSESLLSELTGRGIGQAWVTLHVGAATFQPVRVDDIRQHHMHAEWLSVSRDTVDAIERTRQSGGRVIAVGTTAVRSLETAAADGQLAPFEGDSRLFIYPGYEFRVVDGMVTNFHLPESTLLMLVSAFAGREAVLNAYRHAVAERYRFFSYGDAMLLL